MASYDVSELKTSNRRLSQALSWVRAWWWLALLGLLFQAFWALRLEHPTYFDAYYYTTNAQRLASGEGFTEEIIWQYLDTPQGVPNPSHTYWMPLTSVIGAAGYRLSGTFRGAQAPFWLMAGLLPLLGYAISWRLAGNRLQAYAAAAFTGVGGYYAAYWAQPTTFVLFAWVAGGSLLAMALAQERQRSVWWLVAGVTAGLAHLTRADGLLLLLIGLGLWLTMLIGRRGGKEPSGPLRDLLASLTLLLLGYFTVMIPWFWHMWRTSGSILPTIGTQTIFLTQYDDVFAYNRTFDLQHYLSWGLRNILLSKLRALWLALQTYIAVPGLTAFSFFAFLAWLRARRDRRTSRFLRPFTWYAVLLFVVMSLIFTFPGQRGSLLHSSTALWPWSMALVPLGVSVSIDWIAARRPRWRPDQARRIFLPAFLLMAVLITLAVSSGQPLAQKEAALYEKIAELLPADAVVMTGDPPGFHYHTGLPAIVAPNESPAVMFQVAARYGVDYLLLDAHRPAPLSELYDGTYQTERLALIRDFGDGFRLYAFVPEAE